MANYDNFTSVSGTGGTHTFTTESNRAYVLEVISDTNPSSVTINGVSVGTATRSAEVFGGLRQNVYVGVSPPSGSQAIAVSGAGTVYRRRLVSASNVDQTTPLRNGLVYDTALSSTASASTTTVSGDLAVDFTGFVGSSTSTVGSGQTSLENAEELGGEWLASYEAATGASTTMSWSLSSSESWGMVHFAFRQAASSDTLTVTTQPTTGTSGAALSPSLVVESSDSGFTGNVTIEKVSGDPTISGTLTVAAVAGVATFTNVVPTGTGSLVLRATAAGHDPVTFDAIAVSEPAPEAQPVMGRWRTMMPR